MFARNFWILTISIILMTGCTGEASLEAGMPTEKHPTSTPIQNPTAIPTEIPSSALPELVQITSENADQVQLIATLPIPEYTMNRWHQCNVVFSPDGRFLSGACGKSPVPIWEIETLQLHTTLYDSPTSVVSCEFSPDSQMIACAGFQFKDVTLWMVETGETSSAFGVIPISGKWISALMASSWRE